MAKVTITIEDVDEGNVKVEAEPNFQTIAMMEASGHPLTAAHGYALLALRVIREQAKKAGPLKLFIPKIGHA